MKIATTTIERLAYRQAFLDFCNHSYNICRKEYDSIGSSENREKVNKACARVYRAHMKYNHEIQKAESSLGAKEYYLQRDILVQDLQFKLDIFNKERNLRRQFIEHTHNKLINNLPDEYKILRGRLSLSYGNTVNEVCVHLSRSISDAELSIGHLMDARYSSHLITSANNQKKNVDGTKGWTIKPLNPQE